MQGAVLVGFDFSRVFDMDGLQYHGCNSQTGERGTGWVEFKVGGKLAEPVSFKGSSQWLKV